MHELGTLCTERRVVLCLRGSFSKVCLGKVTFGKGCVASGQFKPRQGKGRLVLCPRMRAPTGRGISANCAEGLVVCCVSINRG